MPVSEVRLGGDLNLLSSCTSKQWSLASLAGQEFFLDSLSVSCGALVPSGCVHAANPSPLPGVWPPKPEPQLPAPPHPAHPGGEQTSLSGWWVLIGTDPLCRNLSALPSAPLLLCSSPWLWSLPPPLLSCQWRGFLVCGNFSSFTAPSQRCRSCPFLLSLFFLFSFALPRYVGSFLPFGKSEVFCQRSVGVLWELFHM